MDIYDLLYSTDLQCIVPKKSRVLRKEELSDIFVLLFKIMFLKILFQTIN